MLRWLRNSFLTGIVVVTPVVATIWLIVTFINFVDSTIKPLVPARYNPESYLPFALPGMGLLIAILALTLLGALAANIFGRSLLDIGERLVKEVVLVEYPMQGTYAVAFVSSYAKGMIKDHVGHGEEVLGVFVPTTPNPTSGFLLFTPRANTIKLNMTIEEAAKLIISFGLVTPEHLPDGAIPEDAPIKTGAAHES